jgi:hypothetical protein
MELSSFQINKIELLAEFMAAIQELYNTYSIKFPEHKDFWTAMAADEKSNVAWIHSTIEKIKSNSIDYNRDRFNIEAIRTSLNFIKSQTQTALNQPVTLQIALSNAVGIEDSLAKKKFYEIIKNDNPEGRLLYQEFISENQKHRDKLNQFRKINK